MPRGVPFGLASAKGETASLHIYLVSPFTEGLAFSRSKGEPRQHKLLGILSLWR